MAGGRHSVNCAGNQLPRFLHQLNVASTAIVPLPKYYIVMSNAIAERLDGIQRIAGFTGREVAQLLRTTPETVSRWRGGKSEPQPKLREGLLQLEWLVGE